MRIVGNTGMVGKALVGPCPVPSADVRVNVVGRDVQDHALTETEAVLYGAKFQTMIVANHPS